MKRSVTLPSRRLLLVLAAVSSIALAPRLAYSVVFFGEDLGAASNANIPNSSAARDAFLAALAGQSVQVGREDFEGFAADDDFFANPALGLAFAGTGVTGDLTGGRVRGAPHNARFAISEPNYLDSSFNQRIDFSVPVVAFGLFVVDANEVDNDTVTIDGVPLTQEQIEARPFDAVDGIFRLITERSPGVFEVLGGAEATFPASDSSALFLGIIDTVNPLTNVIFINGTSGLDNDFLDGFGYDDLYVAVPAAVSEAATVALAVFLPLALVASRRSRARR